VLADRHWLPSLQGRVFGVPWQKPKLHVSVSVQTVWSSHGA
jgi:hypothetical protein